MAIRFECDRCGSVLKIKDELAGKPGKCPKCKTPFTVPNPEPDDEPSDPDGEQSLADDSDDSSESESKGSARAGSGEFDVDAFLMSDDPAPKKNKRSVIDEPTDDDESLDDDDSDSQPSSRKGAASATPKRSVPVDLDDDDDDDPPSTAVPSRRPPGTSGTATAANLASDLLSKSGKKGKKGANWAEAEAQAKKKDEPEYDWDELRNYVLKKVLPAVLGVVVGCYLLYSLMVSGLGGKSFTPTLGRVTGSVKLGGMPVVGAEVWFHPLPAENTGNQKEKKHSVASSVGITDGQGNYELTYSADLKGAAVGKCRIEISAPGRTDIPARYLGRQSTEQRDVTTGRQVIDFDLTK